MSAAVKEEVHRGGSRFTTRERIAKIESRVTRIEDRIALERVDAMFAAHRRENRLLLLFYFTMLGLVMALFRFGVL